MDMYQFGTVSGTAVNKHWFNDDKNYYANYNGNQKTIKEIKAAPICIKYVEGRLDAYVKKTLLHELGHALGYIGHSASTGDVMYASSSSQTYLSMQDIRHLKQVYDIVGGTR